MRSSELLHHEGPMTAETPEDISVATLSATSTLDPMPPRAMAETAVWARHFWQAWWLIPMVAYVCPLPRRAGAYCAVDFLLVLLAHACGERRHLRHTLRDFKPFAGPLMALWGRARAPSQSGISRWLASIETRALEAWRTLFCPTYASTDWPGIVSAVCSERTVHAF